MIAKAVYVLCALTSMGCAALLVRGYLRSRARLLLWSSISFGGLAVNNILLVVDRVVAPNNDLYMLRLFTAFLSVAILLYGLVWESE